MKGFVIPGALALFLAWGCVAEQEVDSGTETRATTSPVATAAATARVEQTEQAEDFLPAADDEGPLPRTLRGYTLLDPAPEESTHAGSFPFEGSVYRYDVVRARPRADVRAYSLDERIFRIVYSDETPPPMEDLVRAGLEQYGKPFQQQDDQIIWIQNGRTLTLRHSPGSGSVSVAIEDEKSALDAYQRGKAK